MALVVLYFHVVNFMGWYSTYGCYLPYTYPVKKRLLFSPFRAGSLLDRSGGRRARRHAPPGGGRREAAAVPVQDPRGVRRGPRQLPARPEKTPLSRGGRDGTGKPQAV